MLAIFAPVIIVIIAVVATLVFYILSILIVIIGFIIWKLKDFAILSIMLAASAGIIFTIPLISTVNYLVEKKAEEVAISEKKLELIYIIQI